MSKILDPSFPTTPNLSGENGWAPSKNAIIPFNPTTPLTAPLLLSALSPITILGAGWFAGWLRGGLTLLALCGMVLGDAIGWAMVAVTTRRMGGVPE